MAAKNWFAFYAEQFDTVALPFAWRHRLCPIGIGTKGKYRGGYSRERLVDWAEWMKAQDRKGRTVRAYFNNDYDAQAIIDARILKEAAGV